MKDKNTPLTLDEIKKIELEILTAFADFCESHNLKYYLGYGTLLGAVRHKGFIPWDDDIDILMPRPYYNKFLELTGYNPIKENLETRMYRSCTHPNIYPFAKVIDNNTIVYENGKAKKNITGLWIDIFPLDGYPKDDMEAAQRVFNKYKKLRNWLDLAVTNPFYIRQNLLKKVIKVFFVPFVKMYGIKRFCKKIDKNSKIYSWETSEYVSDMTWGDRPDIFIKKIDLEPAVELDFEGRKFKAPHCYEQHLQVLYGDYMKLPPEEERLPHGFKAYLI